MFLYYCFLFKVILDFILETDVIGPKKSVIKYHYLVFKDQESPCLLWEDYLAVNKKIIVLKIIFVRESVEE